MRERPRGGRLRTEHAEKAERVEVECVRQREDVEARPCEAVEHRHLEVAGQRCEEPGELGVEIAHHLGIERERRGVGRLDVVGALDERAEDTREHDDDEVIAEPHAPGAHAGLALSDLAKDGAVGREELGRARDPSRDVIEPGPRSDLELLLRRCVEEPEVMHEEEGQVDPEAREVAVPAHRAHDHHRRGRTDRRERKASERSGDDGILRVCCRDGHRVGEHTSDPRSRPAPAWPIVSRGRGDTRCPMSDRWTRSR